MAQPIETTVGDSLFARDDKSGWTIKIHPLSDFNFERLNHDILGVPVYSNNGRVWPSPASGISVISTDVGLPDERSR